MYEFILHVLIGSNAVTAAQLGNIVTSSMVSVPASWLPVTPKPKVAAAHRLCHTQCFQDSGLVDVSDIFYFFLVGGRGGGTDTLGEGGGGRFFIENPGGGGLRRAGEAGGGARGWRVPGVCREFGGGGG